MTSTSALSPSRAAAWLQRRLDRDETDFRRRSGTTDALWRLRSASGALVYRVEGDRVDLLLGRSIGGVGLPAARDAAVREFVSRFYRDYQALFSDSALPEGSLRVERVRTAATTVAEIRQYIDGIPVTDARWTLLFDRAGHLTSVMGAPFDPANITVTRRPRIDAEQAVTLALDHESVTREDAEAVAHLAIEGRTNRLVWTVELNGRRDPSLHRSLELDAHDRTMVARGDLCEHGVVSIPVTHYSHPGGIKDSTGTLTTTNINVDAVEVTVPPKVPNPPPPETLYSLQRIGSGRSRIWNAKPTGTDATPSFSRTSSTARNYFTKAPGFTTNNVFNEQQTYFWAQTLKMAVDEWGREPNDYGHYPVDASRAVNVEIVVNGDAAMEGLWSSGASVYHGYFRRDAPGSWFSSPAAVVPAVFMFNSVGNSTSPQFFGPEYSASYSLIAHEVGHFISWQYGGWEGPGGTMLGGSLNEGHSMVLAALLGKRQFGSALDYGESEYVTTGGDGQWSHFEYGQPALKYSAMDCASDGTYYLAWPFVQAMWRLMNNLDVNGGPIWSSAGAAISNTADLVMYSLYCFTADSTMTWDKLCLALTVRVYERVTDGLERDAINGYDAYCAVIDVFNEHGLLDACLNSP